MTNYMKNKEWFMDEHLDLFMSMKFGVEAATGKPQPCDSFSEDCSGCRFVFEEDCEKCKKEWLSEETDDGIRETLMLLTVLEKSPKLIEKFTEEEKKLFFETCGAILKDKVVVGNLLDIEEWAEDWIDCNED